jgi:hypothetical protein
MLAENSLPQASTYVRNMENGKKEKKSWYQYVFLGVARQDVATWGGIGASSPMSVLSLEVDYLNQLVGKADSFYSEGPLIEEGDHFQTRRDSETNRERVRNRLGPLAPLLRTAV